MKRRAFLTLGAGMAASMLAGYEPAVADLEPDGAWLIYRRYALLIVGQRDDQGANALAGTVVDVLARFLPPTRARMARAADTRRVGVLIGTSQQDVAVMTTEDADALILARPPFADLRDVPLRTIASYGRYVLVCRKDFPARHAFLLARTLAEHEDALSEPAHMSASIVPLHSGSYAFFAGAEIPND